MDASGVHGEARLQLRGPLLGANVLLPEVCGCRRYFSEKDASVMFLH